MRVAKNAFALIWVTTISCTALIVACSGDDSTGTTSSGSGTSTSGSSGKSSASSGSSSGASTSSSGASSSTTSSSSSSSSTGGTKGGNGADCATAGAPDDTKCTSGVCIVQNSGGGHGGTWCTITCDNATQQDPKCQADPTNFSGKCGGSKTCMVKAP